MTPPDFRTWSHENLAKLAKEMYLEMLALRQDLKDAVKAYREIITKDKYK